MSQPIRLHPDNPRYFEWQGQATVLVSSTEHYGAVLNLDFDIPRYLATLEKDGMNYTRMFSGSYVEQPGAFGIARNTLAPARRRYLAPWARSDKRGYRRGGKKFDLDRFSDAYLARLKEFVAEAGRRGVVVELTLFSSTYGKEQWSVHPFNPANNLQAIDVPDWTALHTSDTPARIMAHQEKLVRWLVRELNDFDNLFYEIHNEPYGDDYVEGEILNPLLAGKSLHSNRVRIPSARSVAWQRRIAGFIADEESRLPKRHLIAQNLVNMRLAVRDDDLAPEVSILNFHYAWPEAAQWNLEYKKVIGSDETGFSGRGDDVYRRQAWAFMLAGGGLYNNLDYSFAVGYENGTHVGHIAPGGGSPGLRRQLRILGDFLHGFRLECLHADTTSILSSPGVRVLLLSEPGKQYAAWMHGRGPTVFEVQLPDGTYRAEWIDPVTGEIAAGQDVVSKGGGATMLASPEFAEDIALRIVRE